MTISSALYSLLVKPLELLFEVIFSYVYRVLENPGLTIVFLSLAVNFLVLPLYRRADAMQAEERDKAARMEPMVRHIRRTFRGDERYMMLQAYYRECSYKPWDALKGSVSLLLQVPFFIAAYNFLSGLGLLAGESFGPIADLGAPDAMLTLAGHPVHVLPLLMTVINLVSAAIYLKGFPLKSKLQTAGMALVFLVLLYGSPSGLVFYWTLNNVFSLLKNVYARMKNPRRALAATASAAGLLLLTGLRAETMQSTRRRILLLGLAALLQLPLLWHVLKKRIACGKTVTAPRATKEDDALFLLAGVFLALLTGVLIPSAVIGTSPAEFVEVLFYQNPLVYVGIAALVAAGTFVVWFGIFYRLASPTGRRAMSLGVWLLCGVAVTDYMFFGTGYGNLSSQLVYDTVPENSLREILVNLGVLLAVCAALTLVWKKKKALARAALLAGSCAAVAMSCGNIAVITREAKVLETQVVSAAQEKPRTTLSRSGKNVVVIMMDRAPSYYIPFLMAEKPELQQQFAGFTYYPQTLSYGLNTISGSPALYGGYEYTPERINARADVPLVQKHDEALRVMPVLFSEAGYDVTVCDPSLAGYSWIPNLGIYDDHPDIHTYITTGKFSGDVQETWERADHARKRNFFCYSLFRTAPLALQSSLYYRGLYNEAVHLGALQENLQILQQVRYGKSVAFGVTYYYLEALAVLQNLPLMSEITDGEENTFLMLANDTVHNPLLLREPDYEPASVVDNTDYDEEHAQRPSIDGRTLELRDANQMMHYHVCMAMMKELGKWMDWMRENGVYDNTRIIIVADHGLMLRQTEDMIVPGTEWEDIAWYNPLLLVKDFDSRTFTIDPRFMTNADVPTLAFRDLLTDPVNPATGNPVTDEAKSAEEHPVIYYLKNWDITKNTGNVFEPATWYSVHGNILDKDNWKAIEAP